MIGPIRYPARVMPYVVLAVVLITAVVARGQLVGSLAWVGLAAYLSSTRALERAGTQWVTAIVVGVALTTLWLLWRWTHPAAMPTRPDGDTGSLSKPGPDVEPLRTRRVPTSNQVRIEPVAGPPAASTTASAPGPTAGTRLAGLVAIAVVSAIVTSTLLVMQHQAFPIPRSTQKNMPTLVSDYKVPARQRWAT